MDSAHVRSSWCASLPNARIENSPALAELVADLAAKAAELIPCSTVDLVQKSDLELNKIAKNVRGLRPP